MNNDYNQYHQDFVNILYQLLWIIYNYWVFKVNRMVPLIKSSYWEIIVFICIYLYLGYFCKERICNVIWRIQRGEQRALNTPLKITNGLLYFLIYTGTKPAQEAIGARWANCFSREARTALCEIHWWPKFPARPWQNVLDPPMNVRTDSNMQDLCSTVAN